MALNRENERPTCSKCGQKINAKYHYRGAESPKCKGKSNRFEWALLKGKQYERNRDNFWRLCKYCHNDYDGVKPARLHTYRTAKDFKRIQLAKFKPVIQCSQEGVPIRTWPSATHAQKSLGVPRKAIWNSMNGRAKTSGGFIWKQIG